jgi:hypothetical protein
VIAPNIRTRAVPNTRLNHYEPMGQKTSAPTTRSVSSRAHAPSTKARSGADGKSELLARDAMHMADIDLLRGGDDK